MKKYELLIHGDYKIETTLLVEALNNGTPDIHADKKPSITDGRLTTSMILVAINDDIDDINIHNNKIITRLLTYPPIQQYKEYKPIDICKLRLSELKETAMGIKTPTIELFNEIMNTLQYNNVECTINNDVNNICSDIIQPPEILCYNISRARLDTIIHYSIDDTVSYIEISEKNTNLVPVSNKNNDIAFDDLTQFNIMMKIHKDIMHELHLDVFPQPPKRQLKAVKDDSEYIQFCINPNEKVQIAAVDDSASNIQYIRNPTGDVQLMALRYDRKNIIHIKNPTQSVINYLMNGNETIDYDE